MLESGPVRCVCVCRLCRVRVSMPRDRWVASTDVQCPRCFGLLTIIGVWASASDPLGDQLVVEPLNDPPPDDSRSVRLQLSAQGELLAV